jgi:hypothetical protein
MGPLSSASSSPVSSKIGYLDSKPTSVEKNEGSVKKKRRVIPGAATTHAWVGEDVCGSDRRNPDSMSPPINIFEKINITSLPRVSLPIEFSKNIGTEKFNEENKTPKRSASEELRLNTAQNSKVGRETTGPSKYTKTEQSFLSPAKSTGYVVNKEASAQGGLKSAHFGVMSDLRPSGASANSEIPIVMATPFAKESTPRSRPLPRYGFVREIFTESTPDKPKYMSKRGIPLDKFFAKMDTFEDRFKSEITKRYLKSIILCEFSKELIKLHKGLHCDADYTSPSDGKGHLNLDVKLENAVLLVENDKLIVRLIDLDDVPDAMYSEGSSLSALNVPPMFTASFAAPEVFLKLGIDCVGLTDKADTYAFGKVIQTEHSTLFEGTSALIQQPDSEITESKNVNGFYKSLLSGNSLERPSMEAVVSTIEQQIRFQEKGAKRKFTMALNVALIDHVKSMFSAMVVEAKAAIAEKAANEEAQVVSQEDKENSGDSGNITIDPLIVAMHGDSSLPGPSTDLDGIPKIRFDDDI